MKQVSSFKGFQLPSVINALNEVEIPFDIKQRVDEGFDIFVDDTHHAVAVSLLWTVETNQARSIK